MSGERVTGRRQGATVLLGMAWLAWWHHWSLLLAAAAGIVWLIVQRLVDNNQGERLRLAWRRAWPPHLSILIALIGLGVTTLLLSDAPGAVKVMPIGLHGLALSVAFFGAWWHRALVALPAWLGGDSRAPGR